jgi:hypothetical protein
MDEGLILLFAWSELAVLVLVLLVLILRGRTGR